MLYFIASLFLLWKAHHCCKYLLQMLKQKHQNLIIKDKIHDLPHRFVDWICNSIVILFALWCNSRLCRRPLQSRHLKNLVDINGRSSWYRVVEGIYGIFREDFWHVVYYLSMVIAVYWLCELNRWSAGSDYKSYIVVVMAI